MLKAFCTSLLLAGALSAQVSSTTAYRIRKGSSLPATCSTGDVFFKTSATVGLYQCAVTNTWSIVAGAAGGIGGTIAATQVPYGSAANTLAAMSGATWTNATRDFVLSDGSDNPAVTFSANPAGELPLTFGLIFSVNSYAVQPASVSTTPGTTGGGIWLEAVQGGPTSIATTGVGGAGGQVYITGGAGAAISTATTASTGGAGGPVQIIAGQGGQAAASGGTNIGGNGGQISIISGNGNDALSGGSNTGGDGGNLLFRLGSGGTGSTANGSDGTMLLRAGERVNDDILKVQSNDGNTDFFRVLTGGTTAVYKGADVESAATTALGAGNVFTITGTNNITTLNTCDAPNSGRQITLVFADILTFTDGNNLKLAGNFTTSADDTITLVCTGTNWYEMSRSVN